MFLGVRQQWLPEAPQQDMSIKKIAHRVPPSHRYCKAKRCRPESRYCFYPSPTSSEFTMVNDYGKSVTAWLGSVR